MIIINVDIMNRPIEYVRKFSYFSFFTEEMGDLNEDNSCNYDELDTLPPSEAPAYSSDPELEPEPGPLPDSSEPIEPQPSSEKEEPPSSPAASEPCSASRCKCLPLILSLVVTL